MSSFREAPELIRFCRTHFSLCAEDVVITHLLRNEKERGVFVDIGAYHPIKYSNTFLLYLNGWRGINIDANEEVIPLFHALRHEDISFPALVSDVVEEHTYYYFKEGAYNGVHAFDPSEYNRTASDEKQVLRTERKSTVPINVLLERYVGDSKFDLLSIDVEGLDTKLLTAINFQLFRPKVLCIEIGVEDWFKEPLKSFLDHINYEFHALSMHSSILLRRD